MQVKSKSGRVFSLPTSVQDTAIRLGIEQDPATHEVPSAEMKTLRRGRPFSVVQRPTLNMRIDADVLAALRASGKGWQTRVNALLREAVQQGGKL